MPKQVRERVPRTASTLTFAVDRGEFTPELPTEQGLDAQGSPWEPRLLSRLGRVAHVTSNKEGDCPSARASRHRDRARAHVLQLTRVVPRKSAFRPTGEGRFLFVGGVEVGRIDHHSR